MADLNLRVVEIQVPFAENVWGVYDKDKNELVHVPASRLTSRSGYVSTVLAIPYLFRSKDFARKFADDLESLPSNG